MTQGGFAFDLCGRNAYLEGRGIKPPRFTKTGTTIAGLIFKACSSLSSWMRFPHVMFGNCWEYNAANSDSSTNPEIVHLSDLVLFKLHAIRCLLLWYVWSSQDGVVLGADTRSTSDTTVADKNCEKIHYIAPNIYCCGAGTAADTENVTGKYVHP